MRISRSKPKDVCSPCIKAKMQRSINHKLDTRALKPFEHIYCDLSVLSEPINDTYNFIFGAIDDHSGYLAIYLLKSKSDTPQAFKMFLADHVHFGPVKIVRSDQESVFTSDAFQEILVNKCIKFEMSAPYASHQNARIERAWQTLFNMSRAMQFESKVPPHLKEYILKYATFIINRTYSEPIKKTPYEAVTNTKPNANTMHLFGSLCFGFQHHVHKRKWDPRALPGIFLGYDPKSPAKIVYFPDENKVRKVKDVKFTDKLYYDSESSVKDANLQHESSNHSETSDDPEPEPPADISSNSAPSSGRGHLRRYPKRFQTKPKFFGVSSDDEEDIEGDVYSVSNYYNIYSLNGTSTSVPNTYAEAIASVDCNKWIHAMEKEIQSLLANKTLKLTELPPGHKLIGGRWVYAIKIDPQGNRTYKARWVAKGFSQRPGINYDETYAPTMRMPTLRMLLNIVVQLDLILHQIDVNNAYLNSPLDTEIYMRQPEGFQTNPNLVCQLRKSLYGLKQSAMLWNGTLSKFMLSQNLKQSDRDPCLYIRVDAQGRLYCLFWVDDIVIAASNSRIINIFKENFAKSFKMKDIGPLTWFLGIQFSRSPTHISINQSLYINQILDRFDMQDCKPRTLPCAPGIHKLVEVESPEYDNPTTYREMVGSLIYLATCTRPDIAFVISFLSKFMNEPTHMHMKIARGVLRYLQYTKEYDLKYVKSIDPLHLTGFTDSDHAQSADSQSISGNCFRLNDYSTLISWNSSKQSVIALSTVEAEYIAATEASKEAVFLRDLFANFFNTVPRTVPIYCDNQGAISLATHAGFHKRTKHIKLQFHFIRAFVKDRTIHLSYIPSNSNLPDMFTKALNGPKLRSFAIVRGSAHVS